MGRLDKEMAKYGLRNIGTLSIDIQQPEASVSELSRGKVFSVSLHLSWKDVLTQWLEIWALNINSSPGPCQLHDHGKLL